MRERPVPERPPAHCVFVAYYFVIGDKSYNFYNFLANYYHNFSDLGNLVSRELLAGA